MHNCFILVFNDSYLSYTVAAEYKPPTSSGAQLNYNLYQHYERHWLFWSYGEMVQRHHPRGVSVFPFTL